MCPRGLHHCQLALKKGLKFDPDGTETPVSKKLHAVIPTLPPAARGSASRPSSLICRICPSYLRMLPIRDNFQAKTIYFWFNQALFSLKSLRRNVF